MKKFFRYSLWIAGSLGCLLILLWLGLAAYVTIQKQTILQKTRVELKKRLGGDASIGDMDISFFHHFPNVTVHLSKVTLRDSLWQEHHHDLLDAGNLYISLALFRSVFAGKLRVGRVYVEKGSVYLFTDTTGYSNTSALKQGSPGSSEDVQPPDFSFADVRLVVERQDRHKFFDVEFRRLDCAVDKEGRALSLAANADALVKNFSFNTEKGSFIKDKTLSGRCVLQFNTGSKILQFNKVTLHIDGHPFVLTGRFFPNVKPDPFTLNIQTTGIPYRKATALLTPLIQQKLDLYDVDKPVSIQAELDAGSADDPTPLITVHMNLQDASVNTPVGRFGGVNVMMHFTNEWVRHEKRRDENSAIRLLSFSGWLLNIPLHSDTAVITDLKHPMLHCDLRSGFELTRLNEVLGSRSIAFRKGACSLNVRYQGPMREDDSSAVSVLGSMTIDSATVVYLPYNFQLTDGTGKIRFKDQDLVFDKLEARAGGSKISLKGIVRNIIPLIDQNPGEIHAGAAGGGQTQSNGEPMVHPAMDFTLSSSRLDLEDLAPVLGKPVAESAARAGSKPLFSESAGRLDQLLRTGAIHLQIDAAELRYEHFSGVRAKAELLFQGNEVQLKKMELAQDDGSLTLTGIFRRQPGGGGNPLSFKSHLEQVDLPKLFTAFSNFGQDGLTAKNLKGRLTADVAMTGLLTDKARMVKKSMKGSVNFSIKGGQLIDFEPMEKIHETVLKKRDLSEIRFGELTNQLDLDTTTLNIHRMEIQSTAFTLFVEGTYDLKAGPDLSVQVPLSNLKDRNAAIPPDSKGNDGKAGLSLRLRVRRGDDGKMKISWDPFKKALKKKKG
ncbi:MAG TPA: AsmA-like C-terminal region-containing protein [Puia sp.]|nr:AsmA-like C-terminal region-containing protein [Puia sp.]